MESKELRCTNCGAPIKQEFVHGNIATCKYCGREVPVQKAIDFEERVRDINRVIKDEELTGYRKQLKETIYPDSFREIIAGEILKLVPDDLEANLYKQLLDRNKNKDNSAYIEFLNNIPAYYHEVEIKYSLEDIIVNMQYNEIDAISNLLDFCSFDITPYVHLFNKQKGTLEKERLDYANINRDCFISYSKEDLELVEEFAIALEKQGLKVWYKDRNYDANNPNAIKNAISKSTLFIYFNSDYALHNSDCSIEKEYAQELGKEYRILLQLREEEDPENKEFFQGPKVRIVNNLKSLENAVQELLEIIKNTVVDPFEETKKLISIKMKSGDYDGAASLIDTMLSKNEKDSNLWLQKLICYTVNFTDFTNKKFKETLITFERYCDNLVKKNEIREKIKNAIQPIFLTIQNQDAINASDILTLISPEFTVDEFFNYKLEDGISVGIVHDGIVEDISQMNKHLNKKINFLLFKKNPFKVGFGFTKDEMNVNGDYQLKIINLPKLVAALKVNTKQKYLLTWKDIRTYVREGGILESCLVNKNLKVMTKEQLENELKEKFIDRMNEIGCKLEEFNINNFKKNNPYEF